MYLYHNLIEQIPEFKTYDVFGEEHYVEIGISPLGTIGSWLNHLASKDSANDLLIKKICSYLNNIYVNANDFEGDVLNDFGVYLFWVLEYPTIECVKQYLLPQILEDGRQYLKGIDRMNYRDF